MRWIDFLKEKNVGHHRDRKCKLTYVSNVNRWLKAKIVKLRLFKLSRMQIVRRTGLDDSTGFLICVGLLVNSTSS